jgi:hypothetical protein
MTDPPQSSPPVRTFRDRLRRRLQQGLGFVYGTLLIGILVNLASNLLSFASIFDWITRHLLISGLIGGGLLLLAVLAYWGELRSRPATSKVASSLNHQNRVQMLKRLRLTYQQLHQDALQQAIRLELGLMQTPHLVQNTATLLLERSNRTEELLPAGTSILTVFHQYGLLVVFARIDTMCQITRDTRYNSASPVAKGYEARHGGKTCPLPRAQKLAS